jgi:hypothetical protein
MVLFSSSRGGTFTSGERTITNNENYTVRGVINMVRVPVPDDLEQGSVQSGYFLFTPEQYTFRGKDEEDQPVEIKDQDMFHLTLSDEQAAQFAPQLGKPVQVEVRVILRHTDHQRTPILFDILSLKVLSDSRSDAHSSEQRSNRKPKHFKAP